MTQEDALSRVGGGLTSMQQVPELFSCQSLRTICLHGNNISVIEALSHLPALVELNLSSNCIYSLHNIGSLSALTSLNLASNRLSSLEGLGGLVRLARLNVAHNFIDSLAGLATLQGTSCQLTQLDIRNNQLESLQDLTVLAGCQSLVTLSLAGGTPGNPCCHTSNSRVAFALAFPKVQILDGLPLQPERQSASARQLSSVLPQTLASLQLSACTPTAALHSAGHLADASDSFLYPPADSVQQPSTNLLTAAARHLKPQPSAHVDPHFLAYMEQYPATFQQVDDETMLRSVSPGNCKTASCQTQAQGATPRKKHKSTSARISACNKASQADMEIEQAGPLRSEREAQTEDDDLAAQLVELQQQLQSARQELQTLHAQHSEQSSAAVHAKQKALAALREITAASEAQVCSQSLLKGANLI